ncbi:MAG: dihydroorotase [Methanoculleus sp. SDB]|nr:MAG: dihydroorotase [Methanoculleus sp. SDB]
MKSVADLLMKNVAIPGGRIADIAIRDGIVGHVGAGLRAETIIDATGFLCLPGGVDMHVHMRGGVQAQKETWATGTRSALAGGVTVVIDQPNQLPPVADIPTLKARIREAKQESLCNFGINGSVSRDADIEGMWRAGVTAFGETFAAPSSYGEAIGHTELASLLGRIRRLGGLATIHAEDVLIGMDDSLSAHNALRPGTGEAQTVARIGALAPDGMALHYCHLSCIHSIDVAAGSVEVTPHHLFLSYEMFDDDDGRAKVNPPLRREKARSKVWSRWDRIDVVASDHAPHTLPEKSVAFADAPSGIPGVETMIPLLLAAVLEGRISLASLIDKTSYTPCRLLGIPCAGFVPGVRADFALFPRKKDRVDPDALHSRAGWTPYEGMEAVFPAQVIMNGGIAYHDGEFTGSPGTWVPGRGYMGDQSQI